jgi:hypothetical protein
VDHTNIIFIIEDEGTPVSVGIEELPELLGVGKLTVLGDCCFCDTEMIVVAIIFMIIDVMPSLRINVVEGLFEQHRRQTKRHGRTRAL